MNRYRYHLLVAGLYLILSLVLTWPLAARLTTQIPGEATWAFDESTFIWNMWWLKFNVLARGQSPLVSDYTFFPLGVQLTTYTFNLFNAALGLPLQLAFSLPLANNLVLLFSYISSAYGTFLLVLYVLHAPRVKLYQPLVPYLAAAAAGAVYAFSASRMMYVALGHYNFVTIQWFPFYALFLLKTLHQGRFKAAVMAGLFAALCLYAELTFSVFLLFITLFIFVDVWRRKTVTFTALVVRLLPAGVVAFGLTAPFILAVLPDFLNPAYSEPGWGEGLKLSADLVGLVTLTPLHPLAGTDWIAELRAVIEGTSRFSDANTLFLGYAILALAIGGFVTFRRVAGVWFWSAVTFTILSLGPLLTINGQNRFNLDGLEVTFPLPFTLLHYVPVLSANRVPNRFGIPLTLSLAVLVGYGLVWLLNLLTRPRAEKPRPSSRLRPVLLSLAALLLLVALLVDQYSAPIPLTDARIPEVYSQIGAEPGDFTLMQLPLGWRNSYGTLGSERTQLQYYQSAHLRPMLGGNTSRNPAFKFDYFAGIPLFKAITEAELYRPVDETLRDQAGEQAAGLMALYNIKYLVIHEPIPHRKPYEDTYPAARQLALDLIPHHPEAVYQSPGVQAFAVEQAAIPDPLVIDFGEWRSAPYRGEGWAGDEQIFGATANWAMAPEARLFFPVRGQGDRQLVLRIAPFSYPGMPPQRLAIDLNGRPVGDSLALQDGWQTVELLLPAGQLLEGLNRLSLSFDSTAQPRQVLPVNPAVGLTGVQSPVDIEVNSGTDFAFITVGFGDNAADASAHRRGVNVAVVHPVSGETLDYRGFDTAANEFEAAALVEFIGQIPAGHIVVAATQGPDATKFLTPAAVEALQSIGLAGEQLEPPISAIGVKGAAPGQALQASGEGTAYLRLGANPDTRNLAAAVDVVTISTPD